MRLTLAAALLLAPLPLVPARAQVPPAQLVKQVNIPYSQFRLKNGLRVIVHTDRKAPVVAVSVWYNVGSKHEPKGKTGFAHLFEHLMFNGSENAPGDYFGPLQDVGATDFNGTTWFDRTNYFQTVPTSALDVALFLESDRMGHLLGAVTQEKLDNQRGVVQNEKRQGDNQPYGLVEYAQIANLLPADHPYGHSTIGSMADLDSATLDDVRTWFVDHYGPNNAVLVLAGDIDVATARKRVNHWFGDIPAGKPVPPVAAPIPTLPARKDLVMKDNVATTRLYRWWVVPGLDNPDNAPLGVAASVLGGLASSRLDNILVRDEQLAVAVTADMQEFAQLGFFEVTADVKPGLDPAKVGKRLDEILAAYIATGPSQDEVRRVATMDAAARISALEQVGGFSGKATTLAEGALYSGTPDAYRTHMAQIAAATPDSVRAAMAKWLTRPVLALTVEPGARAGEGDAAQRSGGTHAPAHYVAPDAAPTARAAADRSKLPDVGAMPNVDFPNVETATLSNGVKVHFARRAGVPALRLSVVFDMGRAADPAGKRGLQAMMLALLKEGTTTRNSIAIAEEQERLGANISVNASMDRTAVSLFALTPNLAPSLDLLADIMLNPAFDPRELERIRGQQLAAIAAEATDPRAIAGRTLVPLLYGADHPYGIGASGAGDAGAVAQISRDDLASFHRKWMRADNATILAVGNSSLKELIPLLEARLGAWKMTRDLPGTKDFAKDTPAPQPRIVLIDRPQSPQSMIVAGALLNAKGRDDMVDLIAANDILGGNFLSRINMDLRETKGWSYGVNARVERNAERAAYIVTAPVQADRTGDAIVALQDQFRSFLTDKGVTNEELARTVNGSIRELPGNFETSADVLGEMQRAVLYNRPFDYVETLAGRYRAQSAASLDAVARTMIDPAKFVWVVVGDAATVLPQLQKTGLPVSMAGQGAATPAPQEGKRP